MLEETPSSHFQEVLEKIETLPLNEQTMLIEIVHQRVVQQRRAELVEEVAEAREAYQAGEVHRGTVADLLSELDG